MSVATLHTDARSAWRAALLGVPGLPQEWAWEARPFTPTIGTPWAREELRPISSRVAAIGASGVIEHVLNGVATLFYPSGKGTRDIEQAAGALVAALHPGRPLVYGDASLWVMSAQRQPLLTEPDWVSCPIIITMKGYTLN